MQRKWINAVRESISAWEVSDQDAGRMIWDQIQWKYLVYKEGLEGDLGLT